MSFNPLPTSLSNHLATLDPNLDSVLELGSGEGRLSRQIEQLAGGCLRLEIRRRQAGVVCDVVGDARSVPVRPNSLAVVVAANLVRHLSPRQNLSTWVSQWRGLLKPGGRLFIFEDDPEAVVAAQRNFRDLQRFLARLMPEARGNLLPLGRFRQLLAAEASDSGWTFGHEENNEPIDTAAVLGFLNGGAGQVTGPEAALGRAIGRAGIAPGRYWWASAGPLPEVEVAE